MTITVGFDLDMTLIDARPGVVVAMDALGEEFGIRLDGQYVVANMGPPLPDVFRELGLPEQDIDPMVARFRAMYPSLAIPLTTPMPGAEDALDAVRAVGGTTMIVTAKYQRNADLHIQALGWDVDHVIGDLWSAGKAEALKRHGASVYVGDHVGDMKGAAAADAFAVGVATGPCSASTLTEAGAHVVLTSLTQFPAWLTDHLGGRR
ncbi:HAD family hydrolase [Actinocrispum wychmicini]|uniref:Phosphoglycolate phosphatase n=1 Tax=Actinocrispum wychmicini TaxID=1213861 RepID=A0A4R2JM35_9PSEU|nr:HAD hydrolase-like protein [Actinocrispum wychmicini]TCO58138.1 phosphoglycolate phosphatase [Actinocrispum wychmicini]